MDFLHPALLGGAALAAVPLVLHLLMRQKPKRIEFPALRFIRLRKEANQRRMRIQHWLLLALRIAAICLLAIALARPTMRAAGPVGGVQGPIAAALVFDTAPRMGYRSENQTRLEVAQQVAEEVLADVPNESQIAIVDSRGQPAAFQVDLGAARQRVARLDLTSAPHSIVNGVTESLRLLGESQLPRKEIYVFSDLAAAGWQEDTRGALAKQLAARRDVAVYIVDVGVAKPNNAALGELRLSSQVASQNGGVIITTDVLGRGPADSRTLALEIVDADGKPQKRNEITIELAEGQAQRAEFTLAGLPPGTHQGQVRIQGSDGLPADDTRYFSLEVQPAWKVLIAASKPASLHGGYLSEALAPERFRKLGLARFQCRLVDTSELEGLELANYAAVFVLDPPAQPIGVWRRLADYAQTGGGVALFLGENARPIDAFQQNAATLLPGKLGPMATGPTQLSLHGADHPALAAFKPLRDQIPWDAFPIYHYWKWLELAEGALPLAKYANQDLALVERPFGRGRIVALNTSISDRPDKKPTPWSRLLTGLRPWPFFMLSNELALYLVGAGDSQLNFIAGQPVRIHLRSEQHVSNYLLSTPTGEQIRGATPAAEQAIVLSATESPGQYRIRAGGNDGLDLGFSVNLATDATSLDRVAPTELKHLFGDHDFQLARSASDMQRAVASGRIGRELYPWLIVLVALCVGAEQVAANRFYRKE